MLIERKIYIQYTRASGAQEKEKGGSESGGQTDRQRKREKRERETDRQTETSIV